MVGGDRLEGEVRSINPPTDLCGTVENHNNAFLRIAIEEECWTQSQTEAHLWLSTYGLPADETDAMQKRWQTMLNGLFTTVKS